MSEPAKNAQEQLPSLADLEEEEWDENDEGDYDDEDGDDDIDAQAEEMARKLNEQLWEDMRKAAAAELMSSTPMEVDSASSLPPGPNEPDTTSAAQSSSRKEEAVLVTIKAIIALLNRDSTAHNTLASTAVPNTTFRSVLDAFHQIITTGKVPKATALTLSQTLVSLAGSEHLFGILKGRNAAQTKLGILGKRKREDPVATPPQKHPSIYETVSNAVHVVTHALHTSASINPALITSVQESLRHIFLFSVSLSARPVESGASTSTAILQEISGLIQVLGILSGIQIGVDTTHGQAADMSTMVYPCVVPSCNKTFEQQTYLRTHEHIHQITSGTSGNAAATYDRPFPCTHPSCSASFLRNHDLKRHIKVAHDRKSFECGGCGKTFSRRDAIKRHKDASTTKSQQSLFPGRPVISCHEAEVIEVEGGGDDPDGPDDDDVSPDIKRARTGDEMANNAIHESKEEEDGQLSEEIIGTIQAVVMQLLPLLRAVVAKASGTPLPLIPLPSVNQNLDPHQSSSSSPEQVPNPATNTNVGALNHPTSHPKFHPTIQPHEDLPSSEQVGNKLDPTSGMGVRPIATPGTLPTQTASASTADGSSPVAPPVITEPPVGGGSNVLPSQQPSTQSSQTPTTASLIAHTQTQPPTNTFNSSVATAAVGLTGNSDMSLPSSTAILSMGSSMALTNQVVNADISSQPIATFAQSSTQSHSQRQPVSYGSLSDHQTHLLEQAIANGAEAAQAQVEAESDSLEGKDSNGSSNTNANRQEQAETAVACRQETATTIGMRAASKQTGDDGVDSDADADGEVDMDLQIRNIP